MRQISRHLLLTTAAVAALIAAGLGCTTSGSLVQRGINCFNAMDYFCAAAKFQDIERRGVALNQKGQVRYLVYRGLTHYRLGHAELARRFLSEGLGAYRSGNPNWLPPEIVQQMHQALAQLSGGAAPPPPAPGPEPTPAEPTVIQ